MHDFIFHMFSACSESKMRGRRGVESSYCPTTRKQKRVATIITAFQDLIMSFSDATIQVV